MITRYYKPQLQFVKNVSKHSYLASHYTVHAKFPLSIETCTHAVSFLNYQFESIVDNLFTSYLTNIELLLSLDVSYYLAAQIASTGHGKFEFTPFNPQNCIVSQLATMLDDDSLSDHDRSTRQQLRLLCDDVRKHTRQWQIACAALGYSELTPFLSPLGTLTTCFWVGTLLELKELLQHTYTSELNHELDQLCLNLFEELYNHRVGDYIFASSFYKSC